jgi:hypothetical protein
VYFMSRNEDATRARAWPAEVAGLLSRVEELLRIGKPTEALELLRRSNGGSPWVTNAVGVCQLRIGDAPAAVSALRGLAVSADGLSPRRDGPVIFRTNYALGLIGAGKLGHALRVLAEIGDETNPAVQKVRSIVRTWWGELSFWQKALWYLDGGDERPLPLGSAPGDLE